MRYASVCIVGHMPISINTDAWRKDLKPVVPEAPPEQLMTIEEQERFATVAMNYANAKSWEDATQRQALFSFIHSFVDKIKAKEQQAESPAEGTTD